jgi:hypothetical protein
MWGVVLGHLPVQHTTQSSAVGHMNGLLGVALLLLPRRPCSSAADGRPWC